MTPLPIDRFLEPIVASLRRNRSLVLVAPPGAGKTTRVAPAILRHGLLGGDHPNLILLQPRRVAARASVQRIAEENGWTLGNEVGYQIRFESRITRHTRLRVMTEGILTRLLVDDPLLEGVGAVLLDEFHERNLHTDIAIALLREIQHSVRPDLIVLVMSATLDAQPVARFLGDCPVIVAEGRTFPVEIAHHDIPFSPRELPQKIVSAVEASLPQTTGDVLIFLPGVDEIRRTMRLLEPLAQRQDLLVLPLHGSLGADEQVQALRPSDRRKIVCATNIAETSLTIDGVTLVIDSGYARVAGYDPRRGLDRLELRRISKASADQRAGRAGRTAPGRCIRLWSSREHSALADYELPEIRRVDLSGVVLALHAWGQPDVRRFGWFEPPVPDLLTSAENLLEMLGALRTTQPGQYAITPLGRQLLTIPAHPRIARLLLAAAEIGRLEEGATLAALLSEKDLVRPRDADRTAARAMAPATQGPSDLLWRMELLRRAEQQRFASHLRDQDIDPHAARQIARTRDELLAICRRRGTTRRTPSTSPAASPGVRDDSVLLRLLLLAYPDRVARRRKNDPAGAVAVGGSGMRLASESIVHQGEFFLALDARHDRRNPRAEALVRIASMIEPSWLEELFPHLVRTTRGGAFEPVRQRVVGRLQVWYRDLLLCEENTGEVDPADAQRILRESLTPRAEQFVRDDERLAALLKRLDFLRHALPPHLLPPSGFPDIDPAALLADACAGAISVEQVRSNLPHVLDARLTHHMHQLLNEHAPEAIVVPTGNRIRLDWSAASVEPELRGPVLAVRLQELFGLPDTPRIAGHRVPVVLHLLGPNYRPVQVTTDLASFWKNTYPQVRKDLRARYPKHAWPEDPLTAPPQSKGGRRR